MTLPVRQKLVPTSKYHIKCPYPMTAQYITIHNTANDASAENEATYHNNNNNYVSYHYAIDDKEIVQVVPTNRNAWHCGDGGASKDVNALKKGNRISIGIEICYSKSGGERYNKAERLAIKFTAQLLYQRGWGISRVRKHQDWSGKYCPHRILSRDKGWELFLEKVNFELKRLEKNSGDTIPVNNKVNQSHNDSTKGNGELKMTNNTKYGTVADMSQKVLKNQVKAMVKQAKDNKVINDPMWVTKANNETLTIADLLGLKILIDSIKK